MPKNNITLIIATILILLGVFFGLVYWQKYLRPEAKIPLEIPLPTELPEMVPISSVKPEPLRPKEIIDISLPVKVPTAEAPVFPLEPLNGEKTR